MHQTRRYHRFVPSVVLTQRALLGLYLTRMLCRRLAALSLIGSVASLNLEQLAAVKLRRVVVGDGDSLAQLAQEPPLAAGSLWHTSGAILYASRRPA